MSKTLSSSERRELVLKKREETSRKEKDRITLEQAMECKREFYTVSLEHIKATKHDLIVVYSYCVLKCGEPFHKNLIAKVLGFGSRKFDELLKLLEFDKLIQIEKVSTGKIAVLYSRFGVIGNKYLKVDRKALFYNISSTDKVVYLYLKGFLGGGVENVPNEVISRDLGVPLRTIERSLKTLETTELIKRDTIVHKRTLTLV